MTMPCGCNWNLGYTCRLCTLAWRVGEARKLVTTRQAWLRDASDYDRAGGQSGAVDNGWATSGAESRLRDAEASLKALEAEYLPLRKAYDEAMARR